MSYRPSVKTSNGLSDLPLDAETLKGHAVGTGSGNIPTLDSNGKLPDSTIPHQDISGKVDKIVHLGNGVDLNTIVTSGFYRLAGSPVNGFPNADWSQLIVSRGSDTIAQIGIPYSDTRIYFRQGNPSDVGGTGSWTGWTKVANIGDIPANVSSFNNDAGYFSNAGSSPNLNDGTTITQPGGANAISIKTSGSTGDTGILYLSDDNAYICNSSDDAYTFAVFDKDLTTDFSAEDNASFVVQSSGVGCKIRGNTVIHSGNISNYIPTIPHLYRHTIRFVGENKDEDNTELLINIYSSIAQTLNADSLKQYCQGTYIITCSGDYPLAENEVPSTLRIDSNGFYLGYGYGKPYHDSVDDIKWHFHNYMYSINDAMKQIF